MLDIHLCSYSSDLTSRQVPCRAICTLGTYSYDMYPPWIGLVSYLISLGSIANVWTSKSTKLGWLPTNSMPKLYIPITLKIDLKLWHTENVKSWFKS